MADDAPTDDASQIEVAPDDALVFSDQASGADTTEPAWQASPDDSPKLSEEEKAKILAPRKVVKRPEMEPLPTEYFSYCPGCKAKNHIKAALCGRCGVEIPPIMPVGAEGKGRFGRDVSRKGYEGEVHVPDEVQARIDERTVEQQERVDARKSRYTWRRWSVTFGGGLFFAVLGGGVNFSFYAILVDPTLLGRFIGATVVSIVAGLVVARHLFKKGGGRILGTVLYGAAAVVSVGVMLGVGGHGVFGGHDTHLTGSLAGAIFIFPICFLLASLCFGSLMGLSIELQNSDD